MGEENTQGQGAPGGSQGDQGKGESDEFDKDRALATIKTQRESEAAAKKDAAEARAELKVFRDQQEADRKKAEADASAKLSADEQQAKKIAELEQKLTDGDAAARARVAKAALKAAAAAGGAVYPGDVPALVDLTKVKFDRDGEPSNADELVAALKESRPALFSERKPGSGDGGPRGQQTPAPQSMDERIRALSGK